MMVNPSSMAIVEMHFSYHEKEEDFPSEGISDLWKFVLDEISRLEFWEFTLRGFTPDNSSQVCLFIKAVAEQPIARDSVEAWEWIVSRINQQPLEAVLDLLSNLLATPPQIRNVEMEPTLRFNEFSIQLCDLLVLGPPSEAEVQMVKQFTRQIGWELQQKGDLERFNIGFDGATSFGLFQWTNEGRMITLKDPTRPSASSMGGVLPMNWWNQVIRLPLDDLRRLGVDVRLVTYRMFPWSRDFRQ
ncbi:hypothetical protein P154DRAFT_532825 [Amniculicola lignicola CBS 123094]|uniref:Uncharacterized protein n=1 Tax=Amniculicola lignicola CBS 123094 TaxID=1392246 RepID=A0A6A5WYG1_9PLEO|nr:hypothetical protein P154DRAFT_532825 [Amniculicola lignicola CBS 123094]